MTTTVWNKVHLKIVKVNNTFVAPGMTGVVYIISVDRNYVATVRSEKYRDIIVEDIRKFHENNGKEVIIEHI